MIEPDDSDEQVAPSLSTMSPSSTSFSSTSSPATSSLSAYPTGFGSLPNSVSEFSTPAQAAANAVPRPSNTGTIAERLKWLIRCADKCIDTTEHSTDEGWRDEFLSAINEELPLLANISNERMSAKNNPHDKELVREIKRKLEMIFQHKSASGEKTSAIEGDKWRQCREAAGVALWQLRGMEIHFLRWTAGPRVSILQTLSADPKASVTVLKAYYSHLAKQIAEHHQALQRSLLKWQRYCDVEAENSKGLSEAVAANRPYHTILSTINGPEVLKGIKDLLSSIAMMRLQLWRQVRRDVTKHPTLETVLFAFEGFDKSQPNDVLDWYDGVIQVENALQRSVKKWGGIIGLPPLLADTLSVASLTRRYENQSEPEERLRAKMAQSAADNVHVTPVLEPHCLAELQQKFRQLDDTNAIGLLRLFHDLLVVNHPEFYSSDAQGGAASAAAHRQRLREADLPLSLKDGKVYCQQIFGNKASQEKALAAMAAMLESTHGSSKAHFLCSVSSLVGSLPALEKLEEENALALTLLPTSWYLPSAVTTVAGKTQSAVFKLIEQQLIQALDRNKQEQADALFRRTVLRLAALSLHVKRLELEPYENLKREIFSNLKPEGIWREACNFARDYHQLPLAERQSLAPLCAQLHLDGVTALALELQSLPENLVPLFDMLLGLKQEAVYEQGQEKRRSHSMLSRRKSRKDLGKLADELAMKVGDLLYHSEGKRQSGRRASAPRGHDDAQPAFEGHLAALRAFCSSCLAYEHKDYHYHAVGEKLQAWLDELDTKSSAEKQLVLQDLYFELAKLVDPVDEEDRLNSGLDSQGMGDEGSRRTPSARAGWITQIARELLRGHAALSSVDTIGAPRQRHSGRGSRSTTGTEREVEKSGSLRKITQALSDHLPSHLHVTKTKGSSRWHFPALRTGCRHSTNNHCTKGQQADERRVSGDDENDENEYNASSQKKPLLTKSNAPSIHRHFHLPKMNFGKHTNSASNTPNSKRNGVISMPASKETSKRGSLASSRSSSNSSLRQPLLSLTSK